MSDFGDIEPEDSYDVETVLDPEQVARRLQELRVEHGDELTPWDELSNEQKARRIAILAALIGWLRRQGAVR
ncbi:MAG: hypothetical protein K0S92_1291 [Desertimonas sp.]|nr:hypothetical protein [Desertimonas sp.]